MVGERLSLALFFLILIFFQVAFSGVGRPARRKGGSRDSRETTHGSACRVGGRGSWSRESGGGGDVNNEIKKK